MGAWYLLAHAVLHIPVWTSERLWMSLLIAVGFLGLVRLAEALGIGTRPTRLLAGAVFALWPTFTILIGSSSGGLLPGLLVPWAVLPLVRPRADRPELDERPAWRAAALSGLAVLCMGGINAISTLAALALPGLYILTRPGRLRWILLGWEILAVILATAWWAGPLLYQGKYGFNFLPYIEQAATTTQTMSAAAALRGAGNWVAYLNLGQPWLTAGAVMTGAAWAVAAAAAASALGLAGIAWRDRRRTAPVPGTESSRVTLWLRVTLGVAALYGLAGYSGHLGGPLSSQAQTLLNGTLAALRNVYKIEPVLAAVLALGIASLLSRVWDREADGRRQGGRGEKRRGVRLMGRAAAGIAAVALLAGLGLPYLNGQALQPGSFTSVPAYWQQAATWLGTHNAAETTLVVPADSHGIYTWGQPIDEPLEPLASSPWAEDSIVPYSGGGTSGLLTGAEQSIESGEASPGLAAYLDRAGIRYVLVRNDLDPSQPGYTSPAVVHRALSASGFTRVAAFGQPVPSGPVGQGTALQVEAIESVYPPVEIFQATDPADRPGGPAQLLPAASADLVDGGPASLQQLAAQGLLGTGQAAVIAGQSTPADGSATRELVTDGLRREDTDFGLPDNNTSYTYTATGTNPVDDPQGDGGQAPSQLLPGGTAGHQTTAVLSGAASVTASSSGTWLTENQTSDPVYAFDGNPATSWTEASPDRAGGQWVQITFDGSRRLSGAATIQLLDDVPRPVATRLVVTTAAGRAVTDTRVTGARQRLNVPAGTTSWLRITIASAKGGSADGLGAGISDAGIPGVRVTQYLQPSQSAGTAALAADATTSFSFQRAPATSIGLPGESPEPNLDRTFTTSSPGGYTLSAQASAVPGAALSALLSSLDSKAAQVSITASSTFGSLPSLSAENLLDGAGSWIASGPDATVHLKWQGTVAVDEIDLTAASTGIAAPPTRVLITSPAGTRDVAVPGNGVVDFAPLDTDQLSISFPGVLRTTAYNTLEGDARQLPVGLGGLSVPALSGLNNGLAAPKTPVRLACGQGPTVTIDGHAYQTSVSGTVRDLLDLTPLAVKLCTSAGGTTAGNTVRLTAGRHYLSTPGTGVALAVNSLSLTPATSATATAVPARSMRTGTWQAQYRTVTVGAGGRSYLEVHQAADPGWTATLNGRPLTPVTLDGWQQAFVVPAGAGGTVVMTFAPAGGYHGVLIGSAIAVCLLLAAVVWPRRRRKARSLPEPPGSGPGASNGGPWLALLSAAGAAAVLALVGGIVAVAVPVVILLGWWRRSLVPWLAAVAMCVAGGASLTGLGRGPQAGTGAFGWLAQGAALVALAAALTPFVPRPRGRRGVSPP
jgi:arabinofuranan 3-O-arabinosyltransferase